MLCGITAPGHTKSYAARCDMRRMVDRALALPRVALLQAALASAALSAFSKQVPLVSQVPALWIPAKPLILKQIYIKIILGQR